MALQLRCWETSDTMIFFQCRQIEKFLLGFKSAAETTTATATTTSTSTTTATTTTFDIYKDYNKCTHGPGTWKGPHESFCLKICQILNKPFKSCQKSLLRFSQSGEISPTLVTLALLLDPLLPSCLGVSHRRHLHSFLGSGPDHLIGENWFIVPMNESRPVSKWFKIAAVRPAVWPDDLITFQYCLANL